MGHSLAFRQGSNVLPVLADQRSCHGSGSPGNPTQEAKQCVPRGALKIPIFLEEREKAALAIADGSAVEVKPASRAVRAHSSSLNITGAFQEQSNCHQ